MIPCRLSTDYHDEKYTNDLNHTEIRTRLKIKMIKLHYFLLNYYIKGALDNPAGGKFNF